MPCIASKAASPGTTGTAQAAPGKPSTAAPGLSAERWAVPRARARCCGHGPAPRALIGPFERSGRRGAGGGALVLGAGGARRGGATAAAGEWRGGGCGAVATGRVRRATAATAARRCAAPSAPGRGRGWRYPGPGPRIRCGGSYRWQVRSQCRVGTGVLLRGPACGGACGAQLRSGNIRSVTPVCRGSAENVLSITGPRETNAAGTDPGTGLRLSQGWARSPCQERQLLSGRVCFSDIVEVPRNSPWGRERGGVLRNTLQTSLS